MNSHSVKNNNNKDRKAKAIAAAIPIAGVVVAAAFLSGLSLINSYQPAIAQNMTGNATTPTPPTTGGGGTSAQSACAPTQTGGGGGQNATTNATTTAATAGGGSANATAGSANATAGNASTATNATSAIGGGGIPSASEVREHIEEACMAAQGNDTEGVLLHLNLALNALGGNMATTEGGEDEDGEDEDGEGEGETEG
jgi:hypothetical protein